MKFTLAVLAATAATASAGSCCCGACALGICVSTSYQCSKWGDYDSAYVVKTYTDSDVCNGDPTVIATQTTNCDAYSSTTESSCTSTSNCNWNSATSTVLATASAVAAVVAYAM